MHCGIQNYLGSHQDEVGVLMVNMGWSHLWIPLLVLVAVKISSVQSLESRGCG